MKIKVLLVASENAPGMIPFAAKIINSLSNDNRFEVYSLLIKKRDFSYRAYLNKIASHNLFEIESSCNNFRKLIYKIYFFPFVNALTDIRNKISPDVIHFLTGDYTLASYFLFQQKDDKIFYTVHDLHPHEVKLQGLFNKLLHYYIQWGYKILTRKINNLTTSSWSQLEEIKKLYPTKKIVYTCFPSLVTEAITTGNIEPKELIDIENYILFFGSVNTYKGVDLLIKAYLNSSKTGNIKLVIAGKGEEYGITNKNIIHLNRFIEDGEIASLFKKAKFIVYPYRSATMSGVLSLAYYFNKKVLTSNISFFKDNATKNIEFFEAGNIENLQMKLEKLMTLNSLDIDSESYSNLYSEQSLVESYINLYK